MSSYLWHEVSEKEKEAIKKQAKEIMDNFAAALEKAGGVIEMPDASKECTREEKSEKERKESEKPDDKFRAIMFDNAPEKSEDYIKAEKGGWL